MDYKMQKAINNGEDPLSSGVVFLQKVDEDKKRLARELRKNQTDAEDIFWEKVRRKAIAGCRFRRQQVICGFIVDFYCNAARLVVEIDGGIHQDPGKKEADELRKKVFAERGLHEIRFSNEQVIWQTMDVVRILNETVRERVKNLTLVPSPIGEGCQEAAE